MNVPKTYKIVRRSVAIALGIACIILIAGVIGVFAYYTVEVGKWKATYDDYASTHTHSNTEFNSLNTTYQDLQSEYYNYTLQSQYYVATHSHTDSEYNDYVNSHSYTNDQYNAMQTNYQNEQNQYNNYVNDHHHTDEEYNSLQRIVNLQDSTVWVNAQTQSQPAGGFGFAHTTWTESASYAGYVTVYIASATTTIYVDLIYSSHGVQYTKEVNVGTTGTAVFPVLPATITIEVGNRDLVLGSTETVTITYYY